MRAGPILETILYAEDLTAARHFYEKILGLAVYGETTPRFVFFRHHDQMLLVFHPQLSAALTASDGPPPHGATGSGHVCFRSSLAEQAQWERRFAENTIAIDRIVDWPGGGRSLYVRDPAGNSVEFAESRIWDLPE